MQNWPGWETAMILLTVGVCLGVLLAHYLTPKPRPALMTRISKPASYYLAECLDCKARYRSTDAYAVQQWAFEHQSFVHEARP